MKIGSHGWIEAVARLFGVATQDVWVRDDCLRVRDQEYKIAGGVVLLDDRKVANETQRETAEDVRRSFSEEWKTYSNFLPEHHQEFAAYFDIIDLRRLAHAVVLDLGCGSGRWSAKVRRHCKTVVLVDFSDAIFVAQKNLGHAENVIFFRGDLTKLPFSDSCSDFLFSLGVLHHLEQPCLPAAREVMRLAPQGLFYLYYNLDNRPAYFVHLLSIVTLSRSLLGGVKSERTRRRVSRGLAHVIYRPMIGLGEFASRMGFRAAIPLYESYRGMSIDRIEQDAYDRFFTSIEQRVTREEIESAFPSDWSVRVSDRPPFWHFLVNRA